MGRARLGLLARQSRLRIIEAKRRKFFGEERPLPVPAKHIELADTRHHLGNAKRGKIELLKLGYKTDLLI
jgi:hypothetical protein